MKCSPSHVYNRNMGNVVLIGMPGCGKSTCGVLAAKTLCMDFVDTDLVLQQKEQMPLQMIINAKGNEYFAAAEESAVSSLNVRNAVIATGGSVVYSDKAMAHLGKDALVIYLRISPETMLARISNMDSRGILLRDGETVEAMYEERTALYERYADRTIDCDENDIESTVSAIVRQVKK